MSALHDFIDTEYDLERLRELLEAGENPNIKDEEGLTPLHIVAFRDERNPQDIEANLQYARELINFGANVDLRDNLWNTPLHFAVIRRNYEMVEILLQANAKIDKQSLNGYAALHYATSECRLRHIVYPLELSIVKLLLKYNPELDLRILSKQTPLMLAVQNRNFPIVQELLKKHASVDLHDLHGNTALHYALDQPEVNVNIVRELLRHGCSYNNRNNSGETPVALYVSRLLGAQSVEAEKAKYVFKLFVFDGKYVIHFVLRRLKKTSVEKRDKLSQFLEFCGREIAQMQEDVLAPNYNVYDIARRAFFCRVSQNTIHIPLDVFNKVLEELMKGKYPVYCDLIVSSICSPYMNERFAEVCCCIGKSGRQFLNREILYKISFYLSHFDMLNMMIVCSAYWKLYLSRHRDYIRCSVS